MTDAATDATIDAGDIARFEAVAAAWWDESGPFKPLHKLNPTRVGFVKSVLCQHFGRPDVNPHPFDGLKVLDVGCGGGLMAEPMARLGAAVTGIDASAETVGVARTHAEAGGLAIEYRQSGIETLPVDPPFDAILALEVLEHVADVDAFLKGCRARLQPGGVLVLSTLNQTAKAFLLGIVAAEYILGWLPRGTHDWRQFLKPSALSHALTRSGFRLTALKGMTYNPLKDQWGLSDRDMGVNYFAVAVPD